MTKFMATNTTVTDYKTGLMWQRNPSKELYTFEEAIKLNSVKDNIYREWRLPTIEELFSIVDYSKAEPDCNEHLKFFNNYIFWSSTPYAYNSSIIWYVNFSDGYISNGDRTNAFSVRLVRGES